MNIPNPAGILQEELTALQQRIAQNIIDQGSNATGKTIESMGVDIQAQDGQIWATLYTRTLFQNLEKGTAPWKNAEQLGNRIPYEFADKIQEWIDAKGLDLNAWAVANKIIHSGTKLYRDGGRDTIYSQEIPVTLETIRKRLLAIYQLEVAEQVALTKLNETI